MISEEKLASIEGCARDFREIAGVVALELIAEIRRLRAENAELRAAYERVDKHAQSLSEENAEMTADILRWNMKFGK